MLRPGTARRERPIVALVVVLGHVAVAWLIALLGQERLTSVWRIAIDRSGEVWSAHAGVAPWSDPAR